MTARRTKSAKSTKGEKSAKIVEKTAPAPSEGALRQRRRVLWLLVILMCGGYGIPRLLLIYSSMISASSTTSAVQLYDMYRRKARLASSIGRLPGHRLAGAESVRRLRRKTNQLYKSLALRSPGKELTATMHQRYLRGRGMRSSLAEQMRLCQTQKHDIFASLLSPTISMQRGNELMRFARLSAMQQGHTARVGWLVQRSQNTRKPAERDTYQWEEDGLAQIAAHRLDLALVHFRHPPLVMRSSTQRMRQEQVVCSLSAALGKTKQLTKQTIDPRCRAIRGWHLLRTGAIKQAAPLLTDLAASRSPAPALLLARLALLMHRHEWLAVERLWERHKRSLMESTYAQPDVFYLLNPIFTHKVPPSLLRALEALVESRLQSAKIAGGGLSGLLTWLLLIQGRQAFVMGQPARATRLLQRVLHRAPQHTGAMRSLVGVLALNEGPAAALQSIKRWQGARQTPKYRRLWAFYQGTYEAQLGRWPQASKALAPVECHQLEDEYQGICRLLKARLVQVKRAKSSRGKAKREAKKVDYAESDPLIRFLHTPPTLRSRRAKERALRYIHPGNPSPAILARWLLMGWLDPSGALAARRIPGWHCALQRIVPEAQLLTTYLLLQLGKRHQWPAATMQRLAQQRRKMGQLYRTFAELWLPTMGL